MTTLLNVNNLKVWNNHTGQAIIHNSSFDLKQGSCLAIVGESGSGKSVTCRALMKLNKVPLRQSGEILFNGHNVNTLAEKKMRRLRGKHLYMILQNGMGAFDPSCVIGRYVKGILTQHFRWSIKEMEERMMKAMESVMLKNPAHIMTQYPHQLSGGMLQRMMIALAIVIEPDIIFADEPTTALDTISQFEVVEQLMALREKMGCSMIVISHDLAIVKKLADNVLVMRNGEIVERGQTQAVFSDPEHAYTRYLVSTRLALSDHFKKIMEGDAIVAEG
ncbi:ABC transporter ATP-binding protein [Salipaludibacillus agaradhaerens]|uniref:staphylopine uptake ABC transporter ATP-binding protein CntD n=1 Tax=Salipaludibacillus agaradhaerens TaxID=76935 RepID=UPI0021507F34|nr:ABC transporter ATP-binding protein [Salipaludibacillus agaradhaerens]MCR6104984.1 ABC transporter ATP-binding protein [Salipaludibacillus agaradhaerens]MCR6117029.1 ABC transporter ATP-binding protein [Salipaludibacillus agaradhaerens]